MLIAIPPCLFGQLRFMQATPVLNPEEPAIITYDVRGEIAIASEKIIIRFNFQPPGSTAPHYFNEDINAGKQYDKPYFKNVQFFKVEKNILVMHAGFAFPNPYEEPSYEWEVVGRFKGGIPKWMDVWECEAK